MEFVTDDDLGPRQRAAETKKRRTRERLVSATIDLYSSENIPTLPTLEEVAEEAGVSLPTLYNHFEIRYELHLAALEQLFGPVTQPILTATQAGVYEPPDMRAEMISYVCRIAILAKQYRYLVAAYIQSYFESRQYDSSTRGISRLITIPLQAMINLGRVDMRFTLYGVEEYMEHLLLTSCRRFLDNNMMMNGEPMTTRMVATETLVRMLKVIDSEYETSDNEYIHKQISSLIPAEEYDN